MSRSRSAFVPSVALLVVAGAVPASAQQRVEVRTLKPSTSQETDTPFRRLQKQLDSLTLRYNADELTVADRRRLETEMTRTVERLAELMDRGGGEVRGRVLLRAMPQAAPRMPRGWIGIVVEGAGIEPRVENGELVVRYLSYPRVVSVDPSSPAQIAGIVTNDTLLAYDGRDVRENDINLNQLLRPATKVSVRLRHDGKTREVPVMIAEAPTRVAIRRTDEARDGAVVMAPMPDGAFPRAMQPTMVGGVTRGSVRVAPVTLGTSQAPFVFNFTTNGVAGAQLATVTEGLGKRFGVSGGVLVTSAPPGSPAAESGLEDGDVIMKVAGQPVRTVLDVRRAVGAANDNGQRAVELELSRDGKTVKLALRW